jgi:hypothetical protein
MLIYRKTVNFSFRLVVKFNISRQAFWGGAISFCFQSHAFSILNGNSDMIETR